MVEIIGSKITLTEGKYKGQMLSKVCEVAPEYVVNSANRGKLKALDDQPGAIFIAVAKELAKKEKTKNAK